MAIIATDGIRQVAASSDLQLVSTQHITAKLGDAVGADYFKVIDSGDALKFSVDSDGNARVYGDFTVDGTSTSIDSTNVNIGDSIINLNAGINVVASNSIGGVNVQRALGAASFTTTSFTNATDTIAMTDDPTSQLAIGDLFFVTGSLHNNGLFEVLTVAAGAIVIDTTSTVPGVNTALVDETVAAELNESIPAFTQFNETTNRWEFGTYAAAAARSAYGMVGTGAGGATDFNPNTNPDITAHGTSATTSAAYNIGVFDEFTNSNSTDIQGVLKDLDGAIVSASVTYGVPNLTFGTANAAGSTDESMRRDASLAIFDATVPDVIQPDDAAATGAAAFAARRDHTHGIVCAVPVNIGTANDEGDSTSFSRSNHVHALDVKNGSFMKSGAESISNSATSVSVTFNTAFDVEPESIRCSISNTVDATPLHYTTVVTSVATTGFTVTLSGTTDSSNYRLNWDAIVGAGE